MASEAAFLLTTSSGRSIDLSAPTAEDIHVEDIARALAKICRFGAQATSFYSVAQHVLEVAVLAPDNLKLAALHHDSHEAFAGDLPTPLKKLIASTSSVYEDICDRLDVVIAAAVGIDPQLFKASVIKQADETVRVLESCGLLADGGRTVRQALPNHDVMAVLPIDESGTFGRLLSPDEAEHEFLAAHQRYATLSLRLA